MVDVSIGGKYLSKIYCEDHKISEEHDSCGPTIDHDRYVITSNYVFNTNF